ATDLCHQSVSLYGKRAVKETDYPLLSRWRGLSPDPLDTAEVVARYTLARYALPSTIVPVVVPYFDYSTLSLLDVIDISHPHLPNFPGTSMEARLPTFDGAIYANINGGYPWRQVKRYFGQIEGMSVVLGPQQFPLMKLKVRLLENYPKDMTGGE